MKKIFTIIVLLFAFNSIKAQGNLQFNQVKNVEINSALLPSGNLTTIGSINVPTGKVWKIESVSSIDSTTPMNYNNFGNGMITFIGNHLCTSFQSTYYQIVHFPIWLSSGNYLVKCAAAGPTNVVTSISAIEFNIVP